MRLSCSCLLNTYSFIFIVLIRLPGLGNVGLSAVVKLASTLSEALYDHSFVSGRAAIKLPL